MGFVFETEQFCLCETFTEEFRAHSSTAKREKYMAVMDQWPEPGERWGDRSCCSTMVMGLWLGQW